MRFSAALLPIALIATGANAWCAPWNDGGVLQVCKNKGKTNCLGASSDDTCVNLIGGPFVSGFAGGPYSCTIYSENGCQGTAVSVDNAGWSSFPFTAYSFRCPCV
ncbi:hypothetical protein FN846DRAFT_896715 [Sphaerosporella brunnea]|uniref:Uncharacterized protein n=1 Tax=Sphaerosporella brunnea TaxID=1250544 RepID=A0A5J5EAY5_9PEZI|nr:hypothetical protein FN846DRAFT_896715 [Sphaerosporella brunnea]